MPMIIPLFIMNRGCPHFCLFCNERLTAGDRPDRIEATVFNETVRAYLGGNRKRNSPVQVAFYGGTFTGMPREEQRRLLELAAPFIGERKVDGIRISTRPDEIDPEDLDFLKAFGVTTVEVGAQSLDDTVLLRSGRSHTAADTFRALILLREKDFETGIHLMAGLPGDSPERFAQTIEKAIALRPDMVRIHPTLVLRDTPLAEAFREGRYIPLTLDEAVGQCKNALKKLTAAGIPVIRLGLQTTRELEEPGAVVAGPFHPAFRSLVEASIYLEMASSLAASAGWTSGPAPPSPAGARGKILAFTLSPNDVSNFHGPRRENIAALMERFRPADIRLDVDPTLPRRILILAAGNRRLKTDWSGCITELGSEDLHADGGDGIEDQAYG
jgi:histone acetyltransferase (RNA polymerase elongator complex component)